MHHYYHPAEMAQVTLNGQDVSDCHLLEVAIGNENYGYVVSKMELPGRRMKTQVDGQIMTHTYWGTISFIHTCPVQIYQTPTIIVTPAIYVRRMEITNTSIADIVVNGNRLTPGTQFIKFVAKYELVYAQTDRYPVEVEVVLTVVSP